MTSKRTRAPFVGTVDFEMTIKPVFAWYDLWVGAYWCSAKRRLYVFPVPMLGVVIQMKEVTK